jgi:hypothetical protein
MVNLMASCFMYIHVDRFLLKATVSLPRNMEGRQFLDTGATPIEIRIKNKMSLCITVSVYQLIYPQLIS